MMENFQDNSIHTNNLPTATPTQNAGNVGVVLVIYTGSTLTKGAYSPSSGVIGGTIIPVGAIDAFGGAVHLWEGFVGQELGEGFVADSIREYIRNKIGSKPVNSVWSRILCFYHCQLIS